MSENYFKMLLCANCGHFSFPQRMSALGCKAHFTEKAFLVLRVFGVLFSRDFSSIPSDLTYGFSKNRECSGQVFPDTNLGCSAITGDNPALKLCGRL